MDANQLTLIEPALPPGLRYEEDFVSAAEEKQLAERIAALPLKPFEFHGFEGNRRVTSFGWRYRFDGSGLEKAEAMPPFLLALRDRAAAFAGLAPEAFEHVLLTEYPAGAAIGWHKDKAVFGEVVGVSLGSQCVFRFRRPRGNVWERASLTVEPRSAYLLRGPSRTEWEHSIPAVDRLRYSITYRTLRAR